jgi:hypothetical protein
MGSMIIDERDHKFVLHELLGVEKICRGKYADFSKDTFDMILAEAQKLAEKEIFPVLAAGDREGCHIVDGQVRVPPSFHRVYKVYCEGGWPGITLGQDHGGQGFPSIIGIAALEWAIHNFAFSAYPGLTQGAARLIEHFGTEAQKKKYLAKMVTGEWAGTMALTEPQAGTDVGNLSTKAVRQPDGSFKIFGTKQFITGIDQDLTANIVNPVLARIEGDPKGTKGISLFIVPKFLVNEDGSLGRRNDYQVLKIEEKMGIHGSATCQVNFGDNNACYGELLGGEREGMKIMFEMMNEMRIGVGLQGVASASIAYRHALEYAKQRLQGSSLANMKDPEAPRVPIIDHPDVRRMLLSMKANAESLRALVYFCSYCLDLASVTEDKAEAERLTGLVEVLTPLCKAYGSDVGFRVCETAIQVYGGYGYCSEYPVEQFLRDEKIASVYEGANGIQALDLVGRKLGMKKGAYFLSLLAEINQTADECKGPLADLGPDLKAAAAALSDAGMHFVKCAMTGKVMVPVANAYPFLMMMGKVVCGWLLLKEAVLAQAALDKIAKGKGADLADNAQRLALLKDNSDAAFYAGKTQSARWFVKNVLPECEAALKSIKAEDLSILDIVNESF